MEHKNLGNVAFKSHEFEDALTHYSNAIKEDPNNLTFRSNRALTLIKLSRFPEALEDCNFILSKDPRHKKALGHSVTCLSSMNKQNEAEEVAFEFFEYHSDDPKSVHSVFQKIGYKQHRTLEMFYGVEKGVVDFARRLQPYTKDITGSLFYPGAGFDVIQPLQTFPKLKLMVCLTFVDPNWATRRNFGVPFTTETYIDQIDQILDESLFVVESKLVETSPLVGLNGALEVTRRIWVLKDGFGNKRVIIYYFNQSWEEFTPPEIDEKKIAVLYFQQSLIPWESGWVDWFYEKDLVENGALAVGDGYFPLQDSKEVKEMSLVEPYDHGEGEDWFLYCWDLKVLAKYMQENVDENGNAALIYFKSRLRSLVKGVRALNEVEEIKSGKKFLNEKYDYVFEESSN